MGFQLNADSFQYLFRLRGTVIRQIFWIVVLYIIYVAAITAIHFHVYKLDILKSIVGELGIVISLLLGFRSNDAITRYKEGLSSFFNLKKTVRAMCITVWNSVPTSTAQDVIEKKTMINLLVAYPIALKHYLREEYSYDYSDLQNITKYLPQFVNRPKNLPTKPMLEKRDKAFACDFKPPTNIPQEILYALTQSTSYIQTKHTDMNGMLWYSMHFGIMGLESALTNLEALQRTPIPICYASHLEQAFWIYLLSLPFQLIGTIGWLTIPILGFTFFFFVGVMANALELEDPFGYDDNDLPLDAYCQTLLHEVSLATSCLNADAETFMITPENTPLLPYSTIKASEWADQTIEDAQNLIQNLELKIKQRPGKTRKDWNSSSSNQKTNPTARQQQQQQLQSQSPNSQGRDLDKVSESSELTGDVLV